MSSRQRTPGIVLRGVRRVVTGRLRNGRRVTYDDGDQRGTSDGSCFRRSRRAGYFGYRLPPWIWRALVRVEILRAASPEATLEALLGRLPRKRLPNAPRKALAPDLSELDCASSAEGPA